MKVLKRTLTGIILLAVLLGFIFLTGLWGGKGQPFFDALLIVVLAVAAYEMIVAVKAKGYRVMLAPVCLAVVAAYPTTVFLGYVGFAVLMAVCLALAFCIFIFDKKVMLKDMLMTSFVILYPVAPIILAMQLTAAYGMIPLMIAAASAMLSDAIAYYAGSAIGGPKIFPTISPKKTYAGSIIGLIGGAAGAMIVYAMFELAPLPVNAPVKFGEIFPDTYILFYCLVGTAIAVIAEVGDLFASRIKRELEIKDFSKLLGSHGGLLDRLDSIIFAVIFMSVVMAFIPV